MQEMNLVVFHLLNDYSGSPKVLSQLLAPFAKIARVHIVTTPGGILDSDESVRDAVSFHYYPYRYSRNPIVTILRFLFVQIYTGIFSFRFLFSKKCVFYINTILPVGPAIAAFIMRKRIIYHYHEDADTKGIVYKSLFLIMQKIAFQVICVSKYQRSFIRRKDHVTVIPNALSIDLYESLCKIRNVSKGINSVLMLSSLKVYKGIPEYVRLAKKLPQYSFVLVVNDTTEAINEFFKKYLLETPANMTIYPRQSDVVPFYKNASVVMNLSRKDLFIETFGLTILESMTAGIPVITPTVGGVAELVKHGVNGYQIDSEDIVELKNALSRMLSDEKVYRRLSEEAIKESERFKPGEMTKSICDLILV